MWKKSREMESVCGYFRVFVWISENFNDLSEFLFGFSPSEGSQGPPVDLPEAAGRALVEPLGSLGRSCGPPGELLGTLGPCGGALGDP